MSVTGHFVTALQHGGTYLVRDPARWDWKNGHNLEGIPEQTSLASHTALTPVSSGDGTTGYGVWRRRRTTVL